jgi:ketosteroid isomerase-like protein
VATVGDQNRNAARVRAALEAHDRRDVDTMMALWSADAVFHHGGPGPRGGTYRGADALAGLLAGQPATSRRVSVMHPVEVLADEGYAAAILRVRADRDGAPVDATVAYAARFDADGNLREGWLLASDEAAWDALYG